MVHAGAKSCGGPGRLQRLGVFSLRLIRMKDSHVDGNQLLLTTILGLSLSSENIRANVFYRKTMKISDLSCAFVELHSQR